MIPTEICQLAGIFIVGHYGIIIHSRDCEEDVMSSVLEEGVVSQISRVIYDFLFVNMCEITLGEGLRLEDRLPKGLPTIVLIGGGTNPQNITAFGITVGPSPPDKVEVIVFGREHANKDTILSLNEDFQANLEKAIPRAII